MRKTPSTTSEDHTREDIVETAENWRQAIIYAITGTWPPERGESEGRLDSQAEESGIVTSSRNGLQVNGDLRSVANPWRSDPTMDYEDVEKRFKEQGWQYRMTSDSHIVQSSFYGVVRATVSGKVSFGNKEADKVLETFLSMALQAPEKRSPKDVNSTLEIRNSKFEIRKRWSNETRRSCICFDFAR